MLRYILPLVCLPLSAAAAPAFVSPRLGAAWDNPLRGHEAAAPRHMTAAAAATLAAQRSAAYDPALFDPQVYGTLDEVMSEDFSLMTTGEVGAYDEYSWLTALDFEYPWINMADGYTHLPGWGSDGAYSAGGSIALVAANGQAHFNTCLLDVSASDLTVIEFRAMAQPLEGMPDDGQYLLVEAAETNNMGPSWDICQGTIEPVAVPHGEWTTYRYIFKGGGPTTLYNVVLMSTGVVYVDDVRVYTVDKYVGIPQPKGHRDYLGTSFELRWTPAEGADGYLVTLYEALTESVAGMVLRQDVAADTSSLLVEGVESGIPYFYDVKAVRDGHTGYPSDQCLVWDLEAPVLAPSAGIDPWDYEAEWSEVPMGEVYNYWAYGKRVAETDGVFVITDEKFDRLTDHEGNRMDWTHEDNESLTYDEYRVMGGVNQAGWRAKHSAPFHDYLCIDGWWYIAAGEDAGLLSPEMDLSANNGEATLSLTMASEFLPKEWSGYDRDLQVQCAVAVFVWDEEKGDYTQASLQYPGEVSLRWTDFTVQLTGLTDRCVIGIYAVSAPGNLYISKMSLTQERKAGEAFMDPFVWARYHEGTTISVELPWFMMEKEIYHCVSATTAMVTESMFGSSVSFCDGVMSSLELVGVSAPAPNAVETVDGSGVKATVAGGVLTVANPGNGRVEVIDVAGRVLRAACGSFTMQLPGRGLYLVRTPAGVTRLCH